MKSKKLHWSELGRDKYHRKIDTKFLTSSVPVSRYRSLGKGLPKETIHVFYDRDYVKAYIRNKILKPLNMTKEQLIKFIQEEL